MAPETDDTCVNCKICAKHCPTSAIDLEDCKKIDTTKCIRCCSCVKDVRLTLKNSLTLDLLI